MGSNPTPNNKLFFLSDYLPYEKVRVYRGAAGSQYILRLSSIYQYSSVAPRILGGVLYVYKCLLGIE